MPTGAARRIRSTAPTLYGGASAKSPRWSCSAGGSPWDGGGRWNKFAEAAAASKVAAAVPASAVLGPAVGVASAAAEPGSAAVGLLAAALIEELLPAGNGGGGGPPRARPAREGMAASVPGWGTRWSSAALSRAPSGDLSRGRGRRRRPAEASAMARAGFSNRTETASSLKMNPLVLL